MKMDSIQRERLRRDIVRRIKGAAYEIAIADSEAAASEIPAWLRRQIANASRRASLVANKIEELMRSGK